MCCWHQRNNRKFRCGFLRRILIHMLLMASEAIGNSAAVFWSSIRTNRCSKSICCWHQKQQIIPLRFFEALDPYADGIRNNRKFCCGFLRRLIHMLMCIRGVYTNIPLRCLWGAVSLFCVHRGSRIFRCGVLRRLIHVLMASETTENSAAVFWSSIRTNRCSKSMCCWHQKQQIIPLRFFEAIDPYADGIQKQQKIPLRFFEALDPYAEHQRRYQNSAAVFWGAWSICWWHQKQQIIPLRFFEALDPYADGIRGYRKIRCGFLKRYSYK